MDPYSEQDSFQARGHPPRWHQWLPVYVGIVGVLSITGLFLLFVFRAAMPGLLTGTPTASMGMAPALPTVTPVIPVPPMPPPTQEPDASPMPQSVSPPPLPSLQPSATWVPSPASPELPYFGPRPTFLPLAPQARGLITSGARLQPFVALSFDACQRAGDLAGYDAEIIRILSETHTPATLFLGGLWMRDHVTQTRYLASNPLFELGNHSWSHLNFAEITPTLMVAEITRTQQIMWELVGRQPTLFRFPFGTFTQEALDIVAEQGLRAIQWDVVSGDPDPDVLAEPMVRWVLQQVQPGSIIIMHMNERGWHTAEALPTLIETLRARGYSFVTVSQLLKLEAMPTLLP